MMNDLKQTDAAAEGHAAQSQRQTPQKCASCTRVPGECCKSCGQRSLRGPRWQMSESWLVAVIMAVAGGMMNVYTYMYRGHVFANAQSGNIMLLGVNLSEGNFAEAFQYVFPITAFGLGIVLSELVRRYFMRGRLVHWRQRMVLVECLILIVVGFIPPARNATANALVSFACGIQVESFRKLHGNACATTMCIGNFRSGTQAMCEFLFTRNPASLRTGFIYYSVIASFALGAIAGNLAVLAWGQHAVWLSCAALAAGFLAMCVQPDGGDSADLAMEIDDNAVD